MALMGLWLPDLAGSSAGLVFHEIIGASKYVSVRQTNTISGAAHSENSSAGLLAPFHVLYVHRPRPGEESRKQRHAISPVS